jgi:hypothetical protein
MQGDVLGGEELLEEGLDEAEAESRRFREWLPCFFTESFSMSLSRMSLRVRYDLPAPMRSFTWTDG